MAQLAEVLGLPQRTLSFYEREAGDIPAGLVPPMSRTLGVSVDELLGEAEKKKCTDAEPMRKGGWINGSRADDNAPDDFLKFFKKRQS